MLSTLVIITFIVTAAYDIILRALSLGDLFPAFSFIASLKKYYQDQTLLTVALAAGFIGAITQVLIYFVMKAFKVESLTLTNVILFLVATFIISALMGFPIRASKLFPDLDNTYYKTLGWKHAMLTDGVSGLIVNITILLPFFVIGGFPI